MKSRRAADNLADGWEPSPLPAPGPDGAVDLAQLATEPPPSPPPRICEYGPCRHYHTFEIVMDAAAPMAGSIGEGGKLEGAPEHGVPHIERQHYCYPSPGVETDLGNTPVLSCNRYRPPLLAIGVRRKHRRDLEDWQTDRAADWLVNASAAEDAQDVLAEAEAARAAASSTPSSKGNA